MEPADLADTTVGRFGKRVRKHRKRLELSQMQLAEQTGLHFTYVSSIERGQRNPTLLSILRLAEALGVQPGELVDDLGSEE